MQSFLKAAIDYGDIIYNQPQNETFCEKIESLQYKPTLAITGSIQGTSRDKIYQELGLELLKLRRWTDKFIIFHSFIINWFFNCLFSFFFKIALFFFICLIFLLLLICFQTFLLLYQEWMNSSELIVTFLLL